MLGLSVSLTPGNPGYGAAKRVPTNRVVTFAGDSRTANGFTIDGATGRWFTESRGGGGWAQAMSGNRFTFSDDQHGVGGDTSTDLLARWSTVLESTASIIVLMITVNDRGSANMTLSQSQANVTSMLQDAYSAGKVVIVVDELPRDDLTGTQLANHVACHNWLATLASVWKHVYVASAWDLFVDPATIGAGYDNKSGIMLDGLHPNSEGGYLLGTAIGTTISKALSPVDQSTPWVFGESVANPVLSANPGLTGTGGTKGSTGTVSGSIADNWRGDFNSGSTSMVCACSKEAIDANNEWQVFEFSGTSAATSTFTFRPTSDLSLTEGQQFDFRCEVLVDPNSVAIQHVCAESRSDGASGNTQTRAIDGYQSPDDLPAAGYNLKLWTRPATIANTPTLRRGQVVVQFSASTTVSGRIKIRAPATRQVA